MPTFNLSLKQLSHPKKKKPKKNSTNDLQTVSKRVAFQKRRKSCLKKGSREEGYYNNQKIHIYIYINTPTTQPGGGVPLRPSLPRGSRTSNGHGRNMRISLMYLQCYKYELNHGYNITTIRRYNSECKMDMDGCGY